MNDPIALTLNSPITDEQWDAITDVDFEHTERIWFKTKHGKEVEFVKRKSGRWIEENRRPKSMMFYCSECHRTAYDPQNHHGGQKRCRYAFCPNCGADMGCGNAD